jgi:hypothetical protein
MSKVSDFPVIFLPQELNHGHLNSTWGKLYSSLLAALSK